MVEKVRNNKSDSAQKKTTNEDMRLPKNLRQVGQVSDRKRIYIEDYVMTYIKQLATKSYGTYQVAVLLGQTQVRDNIDTIFVSGAVAVKDADVENDKVFDNEAWTRIYADIKHYFEQVEVVGWYITRPGLSLEVDERITRLHLDNFAGNDKVLLLYDSVEREEAFYLYNNKRLVKQSGYYIYYEKNEAMQTYMIDHKEKDGVESSYVDEAGRNIRSVLERNSERAEQKAKKGSVRYAMASVAVLFLLIVAATMLSGISLNGAKPTSNKKVVIAEATKEAEVAGSEDAKTVVKVGEGTKVAEEATVAPKIGEEATIAPTNDAEATKPQKKSVNEKEGTLSKNPKVVIDGTKPISDKDKAPEKSSKDKDSKETAVTPGDVYKVVKGDTLGSISLKCYKTKRYIKKIMELNNLENADKIYEGQKLKMPDKEN